MLNFLTAKTIKVHLFSTMTLDYFSIYFDHGLDCRLQASNRHKTSVKNCFFMSFKCMLQI